MLNTAPYSLFLFQFIAHLSIVPMVLYATWWQWLFAVFMYFVNGCLGMTMTYHRLLSHRAWSPPKWIEYLFTMFATIGLTGSAISWVAVHREHHKFEDTDRDPHSPRVKGWFWSHFLSMFAKVNPRYAVDLMRDKFYVWQHKYYLEINVAYGLVLYLIDPLAVTYAWLLPAATLWNGGSLIVSTSHRGGVSHDDLLFALTTWGEGYHHTHHTHPGWSRFGRFDLGGWLIKLSGYSKNLT